MANFKRLLNYANLGRKLIAAKFRKSPWPVSISLHVTRYCNFKCTHCYAMLETLDQPDPSLEQIFNLIDELHQGGTLSVRLLGGEPLVRKDLPEIIKRIKSRGMFCELVTNGAYLRTRIERWPEMALLDSVSVSLDGDQEVHDSVRGKKAYEKTMDGINALLEKGFPVRLHAAFADQALSADPLPHHHIAEFCNKHGIPFNVATYCPNPNKNANEDAKNRDSFSKSKQIYRDLIKYKQKDYPVSTGIDILHKGLDWFKHTQDYILFGKKSDIPKGHKQCQAGIRNCFIDSDGMLYSCIPFWGKGINVYEHGLQKAIDYAYKHRIDRGCQVCYNLSQWEYTNFFTFSNPRLLWNMAKNIALLLQQRNRRTPPTPLDTKDVETKPSPIIWVKRQ